MRAMLHGRPDYCYGCASERIGYQIDTENAMLNLVCKDCGSYVMTDLLDGQVQIGQSKRFIERGK